MTEFPLTDTDLGDHARGGMAQLLAIPSRTQQRERGSSLRVYLIVEDPATYDRLLKVGGRDQSPKSRPG
jgi:hypothetical protein